MTPEELRERTNYIGSSDVPAILGLDPYRSPKDVWLEKTRRVEPDLTGSDAADFGHAVEPVLVEWAARKLELEVTRGQVAHHPRHAFMRAQLDGWVEEQQAVVEAKAMGVWNPRWDGREWGRDGTDAVPYRVMAQVNFAMACSTATAGYVVALLGNGMGVRVYYLPRSSGLVDEVERLCLEFWEKHVVADVPPDAPVSRGFVERMIREPEKAVEVDHDWPDRWQALKDQEAMVKDAVDSARTSILAEMQDAEVGFTPFGEFTYKANARGVRSFRFKGGPE
jgi:putative phage-type endonuclease